MTKRWKPKDGDWFWYITEYGFVFDDQWNWSKENNLVRRTFGVYKTQADAKKALSKIKEFLKKEIGDL